MEVLYFSEPGAECLASLRWNEVLQPAIVVLNFTDSGSG